MSDFTSKIKETVDKATSAAREMAQETTNMMEKSKDKVMESPSQVEDDSFKTPKEEESSDESYVQAAEFDMSPLSQESQKLAASMEKESMDSSTKEQMPDDVKSKEDVGKSGLPSSQCMPESRNTPKRS